MTWRSSARSPAGRGCGVTNPGYFVLPPVPNSLFQRDPSCWIYNGVTVNPMFWPARRRESLNMLTIYRYHPMFQDADIQVLVSGSDQ